MAVMIHPDVEVPAGAGRVTRLALTKLSAATIQLDWPASCSADDDDYAIYAGELGTFTSHTRELCSTSGTTTTTVPIPVEDAYYLVVPLDGADEGSYGKDGDGTERPVGVTTCGTQNIESACR